MASTVRVRRDPPVVGALGHIWAGHDRALLDAVPPYDLSVHWQPQREWKADETKGPSMAKGFALVLLVGAIAAAIYAIVS
jgi:hypothetical protein